MQTQRHRNPGRETDRYRDKKKKHIKAEKQRGTIKGKIEEKQRCSERNILLTHVLSLHTHKKGKQKDLAIERNREGQRHEERGKPTR